MYNASVLVTVAFVIEYYAFLVLQLLTRDDAAARAKARNEPFDHAHTKDQGARLGERTFLNLAEQAPPFLAALWCCTLAASPRLAGLLGGAALTARIAYPILWAMGPGGAFNWRVELSTQPWYACLMGMLNASALKVLWPDLPLDFESMPLMHILGFTLASYLGGWLLVLALGAALRGATGWAYAGHSVKAS